MKMKLKNEGNTPITNHLNKMSVQQKITYALSLGLKVVASIRGFRTTFSPVIFYYIEINTIGHYHAPLSPALVELGFWPGLTKNITEAKHLLTEIKKTHRGINVIDTFN